MGLIPEDFLEKEHYRSGVSYGSEVLPAVHLVLRQDEKLELAFLLYRGSGGEFTNSTDVTPSGANVQVQTAPQNRLAEVIGEIYTAFNLTIEELAQILGVSRKTIYNWMDRKTKPKITSANRIYDLLIVARGWLSSGFSADQELLHKPIIDEMSIFDLLSQSRIDKDLIFFAGSRLYMLSPPQDNLSDPFA